jgi:hypothetical protein
VITRRILWVSYFLIAAAGLTILLCRFAGDRLTPFRRPACSRCNFDWPIVDPDRVQYRMRRTLHANDRIQETDLISPDLSADDSLHSLLPDRKALVGRYVRWEVAAGEIVRADEVSDRPAFGRPFVDGESAVVVATTNKLPNLECSLHAGDDVTIVNDVPARIVAFTGDGKVYCAVSKAAAVSLVMRPLPAVTALGLPKPEPQPTKGTTS